MPVPTSVYTWDSAGSNLTTTTGGHQTNGYANSEIPTSGEMNYWMKSVSEWLAWFQLNAQYTAFRWIPAASGRLVGSAVIDGATGGVKSGGVALDGAGYISVNLPIGTVVSELGVNSLGDGANDLTVNFGALNGDGTFSTFGTLTRTDQAASWSTATAAITPHTIAADKSYYIGFFWSGTGSTVQVQGVGYKATIVPVI